MHQRAGGSSRRIIRRMDLFTFLGWTLLFYLAYKLGVYVERKLKEKREPPPAPPAADADPDRKP